MSAVIIPFPAHRPAREIMDYGLARARENSALAASAERRAYIMGYLAGFLKQDEASPPERKHKA